MSFNSFIFLPLIIDVYFVFHSFLCISITCCYESTLIINRSVLLYLSIIIRLVFGISLTYPSSPLSFVCLSLLRHSLDLGVDRIVLQSSIIEFNYFIFYCLICTTNLYTSIHLGPFFVNFHLLRSLPLSIPTPSYPVP